MSAVGRLWRDLSSIVETIEARMEQLQPGALLALWLSWSEGTLRVQGDVASETARSTLLRQLAAIPGAPPLRDELVVTGFFEPATDDEWFLAQQPAGDQSSIGNEASSKRVYEEAIVRHPSLSCETPLVAGATIGMVVDLVQEPDVADAPALELATLAPGWGELVIDVIATSSALVSPVRGSIRVYEDGTSERARLETALRPDLALGLAVRVSLMFFEKDRHCGDWDADLGPVVGTTTHSGDGIATPHRGLALGRHAEAPVLTVVIRRLEQGRLDWLWHLRRDVEVGQGSIDGSTPMADAAEWSRRLIRECPSMPGSTVVRRMASIGEDVWSNTPADFRAMYKALRAELGSAFEIQLILDEHSVPWEMMVPDVEGGQPLYLTHPIARWPVVNGMDRPSRLPGGTACSFVPRYEDNRTLPAAVREGEWLESRLAAVRRPATVDGFLSLLDCTDAPESVSMVHFAGHGRSATADDVAGLQMEDGWILTADLNSTTAKLGRRDRSMVVLNACEMADVNSDLRWVSGWAPHLVHHGFGAVVAPLWRVQDEAAHDVVVAGLGRMYIDGSGLGAAFAAARSGHASVSSAPYAFVTYGDVMAGVTR